ncbi:MAG: heparan N-sulfatase [Sphingobacteriaceae bacterium]|nr:heparan N-sulfatase [Sphingobacteriaceae bacterium]
MAAAQGAAQRPNVIIIMADDLDSRQLSCYGGKNISTPNIDRLAKEGLKFTNNYASEAMCVPIRASLFTGLYPARHGSFQNHKQASPGTKSIAHYLPDLGYTVALTGKNHSTRPESIFPFQFIDGFEPNCVSATDNYSLAGLKKFITTNKKPYCLFVMSINPHAPWTVGDPSEFDPDKLVLPPNWIDTKLARTEFCKYLAEVRQLDNQVGEVLKTLKEAGQEKNTLVMFLGEQGPQFPGGKWTLWDNGIRSAMIARFPGKIKPGSETSAMVQYEDITPTIIDLAGGKPLANLDGKSFLPVFWGQKQEHRDFAYGIHNNIPAGTAYPMRSIRDSKYKLILNLSPEKKYHVNAMMNPNGKKKVWDSWVAQSTSDKQAKFITDRILYHPAVQLYDIRKDPYELNDLAADPANKTIIEKYIAKLKEWTKQQGDTGAAMDIDYGDGGEGE